MFNRGIASEFNVQPNAELYVKKDGSVKYADNVSGDPCCIVDAHTLGQLDFETDEYRDVKFGNYIILLKN